MNQFSEQYITTATQSAKNVVRKIMPMDEMPQNLLEAYDDLTASLLNDENGVFVATWDSLPASAQKMIDQATFHGFFIGQSWLKLSIAGQEIAELANSDDAIDEKAYQGVFASLIDDTLKESIKLLKKSRTDRSLLNKLIDATA